MSNYDSFNPIEFGEDGTVQTKIAFLVKGTVEITPYMGESRIKEKTHIVYASSTQDAIEKFEDYYKNKTIEYSVYYTVYHIEVDETLI